MEGSKLEEDSDEPEAMLCFMASILKMKMTGMRKMIKTLRIITYSVPLKKTICKTVLKER